jgi:hypothetical protein
VTQLAAVHFKHHDAAYPHCEWMIEPNLLISVDFYKWVF